MKKIQLTQGQVALVDDDMYEELSQHKWYALKHGNTFYARRNTKIDDSETATVIMMHHVIIDKPPAGFETDHRTGNGLDNQRRNLRFITHRQNGQNLRNRTKISQYPGVSWIKRDQKFQAKITISGKQKHLGYFTNELQAFQAYQQAVKSLGQTVIDTPQQEISHGT